jgi:hypothetical protein
MVVRQENTRSAGTPEAGRFKWQAGIAKDGPEGALNIPAPGQRPWFPIRKNISPERVEHSHALSVLVRAGPCGSVWVGVGRCFPFCVTRVRISPFACNRFFCVLIWLTEHADNSIRDRKAMRIPVRIGSELCLLHFNYLQNSNSCGSAPWRLGVESAVPLRVLGV